MIFSHGLGGNCDAATYLGQYWSAHGYICVFVQHPGSDTEVVKSAMGGGREAILENMKAAASGENLLARAKDIKFVLDELERRDKNDLQLQDHLDLSKIALAGHSFGAATTLAIAGQTFGGASMAPGARGSSVGSGSKQSYGDSRIKAAIYLCPPVTGYAKLSPAKAYGSIRIAGMLLTGTEDNSPIRDTRAEERRIPYDGITAPHQYLVNFVGADHGVFGGRAFRPAKAGDEHFHEMIEVVTTKFLDANLKGDAGAWRWLDSGGACAYLGSAASYEKK